MDYSGVGGEQGFGGARKGLAERGAPAFHLPDLMLPMGWMLKKKGCCLQTWPPSGSKEQQAGEGPHLQDVSTQVLLEDFRDPVRGHSRGQYWIGR